MQKIAGKMSEISYNSGENCDEFRDEFQRAKLPLNTEEWSHATPYMMIIILYSTVMCSIIRCIFMNNDVLHTQENCIISVREYM